MLWFWIIFIIILLIVLEEGLYYLSNWLAFDKEPKEQLHDNVEEKSAARQRRLFRRKH
ncbi:hypothetical protein [Ornithinibacillus sp. 179-J 7C1 HS]|uniref:hypothetical protein n=1 Tax=Ornithinibacillus sp. 179-J 7C1 HS TaxID=3142384 RepID=UPI00399F5E08